MSAVGSFFLRTLAAVVTLWNVSCDCNGQNVSGSTTATIRAGIILTVDTDLPYDYNVVAPALQAAYLRCFEDYRVRVEPINYLYSGGCNVTAAVGQTFLAANDSVDFLIGTWSVHISHVILLLQ